MGSLTFSFAWLADIFNHLHGFYHYKHLHTSNYRKWRKAIIGDYSTAKNAHII